MNLDRVKEYKLVLARVRGLVVGAYRPAEWLPATRGNFPELSAFHQQPDLSHLYGFIGQEAEPEIWEQYVNKRVPEQFRHSRNAIRYLAP